MVNASAGMSMYDHAGGAIARSSTLAVTGGSNRKSLRMIHVLRVRSEGFSVIHPKTIGVTDLAGGRAAGNDSYQAGPFEAGEIAGTSGPALRVPGLGSADRGVWRD
jgi:hypothetical protein